jgi:hypothetical protein
MDDATLAWQASPSTNVTSYSVIWVYNGVNQAPITVNRTSALDASGYTLDFATSTSITPKGGDTIDAIITAVDTPDSLVSTPVTPPAITIPIAAPAPPQSVTLVPS